MKNENEIEALLKNVELDFSNTFKPFVCRVCKLRFKTNTGAWRHLDSKHRKIILGV